MGKAAPSNPSRLRRVFLRLGKWKAAGFAKAEVDGGGKVEGLKATPTQLATAPISSMPKGFKWGCTFGPLSVK